MRILVTGAKGQLGADVLSCLQARGADCLGLDIIDFDLTDRLQTIHFVSEYSPKTVIHCAAYTAVDRAESEKSLCSAINVLGTRNIAEACKEIDAKLLYISTDYVFDGSGNAPIEIDAPKRPLNHYGLTKAQGEDIVQSMLSKYFIVRTSWIFSRRGVNFFNTILRLAKERDCLRVVFDQIGSPTYAAHLSRLIIDIVNTEKYGVYHATNEGFCSWFEFAQSILRLSNSKTPVFPISTSEYISQALRPLNSRLSKTSLDASGFERLPSWKDGAIECAGDV